MSQEPYSDTDDILEPEEIEAYCVSCKQTTVMENPTAVWTRRGAPGTRGACSICGTTVFRMGRTDAHADLARPEMGHMLGDLKPVIKTGRGKQASFAVYMNYSLADTEFAAQLAEDLSKAGIPTWYDPEANPDEVSWASGIHPALQECSHMVVVLSDFALHTENVERDWTYFREQRKPVLIAQVVECDVPEDLRTRPRFDFQEDYRGAFRQLVQALSS